MTQTAPAKTIKFTLCTAFGQLELDTTGCKIAKIY